jgi:hypothetical protein
MSGQHDEQLDHQLLGADDDLAACEPAEAAVGGEPFELRDRNAGERPVGSQPVDEKGVSHWEVRRPE